MAATIPKSFVGHVTSAGVTRKVATVMATFQHFDKYMKKHWTKKQKFHISDPTQSLHTHDVVRVVYNPYLSRSKNVTYTVAEIVTPWGPSLAERPPLLTEEERAAKRILQVFERGGKPAHELWDGRLVVDEGGRLRAVAQNKRGIKKFGGILEQEEIEKMKTEEKEIMVSRGLEKKSNLKEGRLWWVDKHGLRRRIQIRSETMEKIRVARDKMLRLQQKVVKAEDELEPGEKNVEQRMGGLKISEGQTAVAEA